MESVLKNILIIILLGSLQNQLVFSFESKEITLVPSLQEIAQIGLQKKIELEQSTLLEEAIRQELEIIPQDLQSKFVETYVKSFDSQLDLIRDKKLPLYIKLVPEFALDIMNAEASPFITDLNFTIQTGRYSVEDGSEITLNEITFSEIGELFIPLDLSNIYRLVQLSPDAPFDKRKIAKKINLNFHGQISNRQLQVALDTAPVDKISILGLDSTNLKSIPASIGRLQFLDILKIWNNYNLLEIPAEIGNLTNLKELKIINNPAIQELPIDTLVQLFENELRVLTIDQHTFDLIPENVKGEYFDSVNENLNGIFEIKIKGPKKIGTFLKKHRSRAITIDLEELERNRIYTYSLEKFLKEHPDKNHVNGKQITRNQKRGWVVQIYNLKNFPNTSIKLPETFKRLPILGIEITGEINKAQLDDIITSAEKNKNLEFLSIHYTNIGFLPLEIQFLDQLSELALYNNPNLLSIQFLENLLYQNLETLFLDEPTLALFEQTFGNFIQDISSIEPRSGLFLHKITINNPFKSVKYNIKKEEIELTDEVVEANLNNIPEKNAVSIIQTYIQNLFDTEFGHIDLIKDKIKTAEILFKNNSLWRAYVEWLIENDQEITLTVDLLEKGVARNFSDNNLLTSTIIINLETFDLITLKQKNFIKNIFQPKDTQKEYDVSEYIDFIPSVNVNKIEYPNNITLFFDRYSALSFWTLQSLPAQDLTQETLAFYLESIDPEFLEKVTTFTLNVNDLFGVPEQIDLLENLEELNISGRVLFDSSFSDIRKSFLYLNFPENILLLQNLKRLLLLFPTMLTTSNTLPNSLFEMPNLEQITLYEHVYQSLPDEIKSRFVRTVPFQDQDGNRFITLFLK